MKALYTQNECIVKYILEVFESMDKIKPILERLRDHVGVKTDKELCEKVKIINYSTLDTWKNRDRIPPDKLRLIAKEVNIDPLLLEFGQGEMLESEQSNSPQSLVDTDKFISIPIVTAKASGSPVGEIHYDVVERGEVSIAKMLFKTMPNIENVQAVEVIGNSMSPRINPGDYVIIDKMNYFDHDGVYVLQFDSMLLVKRLQVTTKGIKIISDNRMYDEDLYDPEDDQRLMHIVGKVILVINRDMASF